jgi:hypothetical protein
MTTPAVNLCDKHTWCIDCDDQHGTAKEPETAHAGPKVTLSTPPHMEPNEEDPSWLLSLQLWATNLHCTTPRAYLSPGDGEEELSMDADQLVAFAGQLADFRNQVLGMAAQLRQGSGS